MDNDSNKYKFFSQWPTDIHIHWVKEGRLKLNSIIESYNTFMRDTYVFKRADEFLARSILILIEEGLQTWANVDGGEEWKVQLRLIKEEVNKYYKP